MKVREPRRRTVNTRLLVAGCVAAMSVALVSAQSGQPARQSSPTTQNTALKQQARPQPQAPASNAKPAAAAVDATAQRALIDQYCVVCHNEKQKTANLLLDHLDLSHLGQQAEIGE